MKGKSAWDCWPNTEWKWGSGAWWRRIAHHRLSVAAEVGGGGGGGEDLRSAFNNKCLKKKIPTQTRKISCCSSGIIIADSLCDQVKDLENPHIKTLQMLSWRGIIILKIQRFALIFWLPHFTFPSRLCSLSMTNLVQRGPSSWPIFSIPSTAELLPNKARSCNFPMSPGKSKAGRANESLWFLALVWSTAVVWFPASTK